MQQNKLARRLSKATKSRRKQHTEDTQVTVEWGQRLDTAPPSTPSTRRVTRHSGLTNKELYKSIIVNGTEYSIGDAVAVKSSTDDPHLAIIYKLWQNERGERQAVARWLMRPHEMHTKRVEAGPREVFYSNAEDLIAPEMILRAIRVVASGEDGEWVCRRSFEEHSARISELDWASVYGKNMLLDARVDAELFGQKLESRAVKKQPAKGVPGVKKRKHEVESDDGESTEDESFMASDGGESAEEKSHRTVRKVRSSRVKEKTRAVPKRRARLHDMQPQAVNTAMLKRASRTTNTPQTDGIAGRTMYEAARLRLHVSAVPATLPCRESEFAEIYGHLHTALEERTSMCMYISGVPGTGKTATVRECVRMLRESADDGCVPAFEFIELNGMKMTEPQQTYVQLWQAIGGERATPKHAAQLLDAHFNTPSPRRHTYVVVVDELDLLVTKSQSIMYNLFDWPHRPHAKLIVVAIANTMDLPERMLHHKVSSRLGLTRINFQPYAHAQLMAIVRARLVGCAAFDADAIELCARKVGAVSGDARRALDVCRRAVEIVEHEWRAQPTGHAMPMVTMMDIDRAVKEMQAAPHVTFIRNASAQQKVFLVAMRAAMRKAGVAEVPLGDVALVHRQLCLMHAMRAPSYEQIGVICAQLGASRCVLAESSILDVRQLVRLAVAEDDITVALKPDPVFSKLATS
ncbi:Origin recognition complex, subunit 1 [Coemansia sp. RSA 1822]|nr:Origin recognition complex, subunit 1 [Coemansia sp. RSA 1822]